MRSAVICYNIGHKFNFSTELLQTGENTFILSLPYNATDYVSLTLVFGVDLRSQTLS